MMEKEEANGEIINIGNPNRAYGIAGSPDGDPAFRFPKRHFFHAITAGRSEGALSRYYKSEDGLGWQPKVSLEEGLRRTIAPHGAGLANLMFCRPGTRILQLYSPNYVNPLFWYMSNQVGLNYYYFIGQGERLPISLGFGDVGIALNP